MSGSEDLKGRVKVLPTTVRVSGIKMINFIQTLPEILKKMPELGDIRGSNLSLNFPNASLNMAWASEESFNISCNDPEILDVLIQKIENLYDDQ